MQLCCEMKHSCMTKKLKKKLCEAELDDLAAISKESQKSNMAAYCMPSLLRC